jgi:transcriptional regulator with XRE-family HTH domain
MAGKPDMRPAVQAVREAQGQRLERLRRVLNRTQTEAAEMARISGDSWYRMERGLANLDGTHLAIYAQEEGITIEYVLTGGLDGLPDAVKRSLIEAEIRDRLVAEGHMPDASGPARRGRPRRKSTTCSEAAETPAEVDAAAGPPLRRGSRGRNAT